MNSKLRAIDNCPCILSIIKLLISARADINN